jgi:hypothetical protein
VGTPTAVPVPTPSATPHGVALDFVSVVGGRPRGQASIVVQTVPAAACTLAYVTPSGTRSTARGVGPATADTTGRASWSWMIGSNTNPGVGTVSVTCNGTMRSTRITIG